MATPPEDQTRLWVRDDGTVNPRINARVKQTGMKKADWLRGLVEFGLQQDDPLFFANRGKRTTQRGKCKSA